MTTIKPLHEHLGIEQGVYETLVQKVPPALLKAIKEQETPEAIKAAVIFELNEATYNLPEPLISDPHLALALLGIMVEQAYNSAVLASKKPLFGKRK